MKKTNTDTIMSLGEFSQMVTIPAGSKVTVMSGQTALSTQYAIQGGDDVLEQARYALQSIKLALEAIEADFSQVAKLKCYVKDMNGEVAMNLPEVIEKHGGTGFALTVIGVDFIGIEGCLIEIEATVVQ